MEPVYVLQINLNHCAPAQDACIAEATRNRVGIILLAEPYVRRGTIQAPGWHVVLNNRSAILVAKDLPYVAVDTGHPETAAVIVCGILFASVYSPPETGDLEGALSTALEASIRHRLPLVVGGDFNCRSALIHGETTNARGEILEHFLSAHSFQLRNDSQPTWSRDRLDRTIFATLDYTIHSPNLHLPTWQVLDTTSLSDHKYILFSVLPANSPPPKQPKFKLDLDRLKAAIGRLPVDPISPTLDPDAIERYVSQLHDELSLAMSASSEVLQQRTQVNWWNDELEALKSAFTKVTRLHRRAKDPFRRAVLGCLKSEIRVIYRNAIREEKQAAWRAFCTQPRPWGKPYSAMKGSSARGTASSAAVLVTPQGERLVDPDRCAAFLLDTKFPSDPDPSELRTSSVTGIPCPADYVTSDEIGDHLRTRNNRSAPGPDGINYKCLKALHLTRPAILEALYNVCLQASYFPSVWKRGRVVFIPKPGKDPTSPAAYRPITLLPVMGKVFERVLLSRLELHLSAHDLLHARQYGFRKKRSTEHAVNDVIHRIKTLHETYPIVAGIALDIQGAFDNARWVDILRNLDSMLVPSFLVSTIRSYFTNRVITHGSSSRLIDRGCPQGSVLGPTLWNIVFNDILSSFEAEWSATFCFADDTFVLIGASFVSC